MSSSLCFFQLAFHSWSCSAEVNSRVTNTCSHLTDSFPCLRTIMFHMVLTLRFLIYISVSRADGDPYYYMSRNFPQFVTRSPESEAWHQSPSRNRSFLGTPNFVLDDQWMVAVWISGFLCFQPAEHQEDSGSLRWAWWCVFLLGWIYSVVVWHSLAKLPFLWGLG